jgi:hypothetical protein
MNTKPLQSRHTRLASLRGGLAALPHHRVHTHVSMALSRRQFLGTAAGVAGLLLGSSLLSPARAVVCADPKPIPGGFAALGHFYHVLAPGHPLLGTLGLDKEDPSTITDFNGHIGLAYVVGMGTHTDKVTGDVSHLPYEIDLRFMKGGYVGEDGKNHHGTFALI